MTSPVEYRQTHVVERWGIHSLAEVLNEENQKSMQLKPTSIRRLTFSL